MLVMLLVAVGGCATVEHQTAPTGTLDKLAASREIILGYRESSVPFSSVGADRRQSATRWSCVTTSWPTSSARSPTSRSRGFPVTVEYRIPALLTGNIDLECGSTTKTFARQEQVDFSVTTFLTGGSLLTLAEAPVGTDLRNIRIAVIPGTTTEQVLRPAVTKSGAAVEFIAVSDHAEGLAALERQTADAYASDRIILIGLAFAAPNPARFALADRYFSYEPYALMLRRGDPAFRLAVNRALARLYRSGQILEVYNHWFGRARHPQ